MIEFRARAPVGQTTEDSQGGYERIYRERPIQQLDSFYQWALALAAPRPGDRLLDVSCGVGRLVDLATRAGVAATGVDWSVVAIQSGRAAGGRGGLVVGDAQALPFADASFDRVVNLGSLEHYQDPEQGAAEMARVLRPTGRAVVLLPNAFSYQHVWYVWRHGEVFDDGQPLQRYATRAAWRALLERHGLQVRRTVPYLRVRPQNRGDAWRYLLRPRYLLQALVARWLPLDAANCFVFLCARARSLN